jgi:hypothetical protein
MDANLRAQINNLLLRGTTSMALASSVQFDLNMKGSVTGREYVGLFEAKTKTSVLEMVGECT